MSLLAAVSIAGPLCAGLLSGCLGEPGRIRAERETAALEGMPWTDPSRVVAEVNGRRITRGDYYQRVLGKFGTHTVLRGIIKEELFSQEAARRGLAVSPEEVEARVNEMIAEEAARAGGEVELREIYREQGLTLEELRHDYARDVGPHLLAGKVTRAMRAIDDSALRRYYGETYARTRRRVRHIPYTYPLRGFPPEELDRLKALAREKASRSAKRIREGADFAEIARQESEDATRDAGGDIGFVSEDVDMDQAMKTAVFSLKPGEVSDPVENNLFGAYHLVQVTEIVPQLGFEEARERMRGELAASEPDLDEIRSALGVLWDRASVKTFDAPLERSGEGPAGDPGG